MPSLLENPTEDTLRKYTVASEWEFWLQVQKDFGEMSARPICRVAVA